MTRCDCYHRMGHTKEIWELLRTFLPEFLLPELVSPEEKAAIEERSKEETPVVSALEVTGSQGLIGHWGQCMNVLAHFSFLAFLSD